ncbi:MAG: nitroreductase [Clostridia bacterium]|nr:nitroreductase [Clostridia bacterium]
MSLEEMIYKRKSTRSFTDENIDAKTMDKIKEFCTNIKPLYDDIEIFADFVSKKDVKCVLPWKTPQMITIYSEEKEGMYENVGFIFQQLDLYLQSLELGVCWLGIGKSKEDRKGKLKYVIMMAFGYPKGERCRSSVSEFKRKPLCEIALKENKRLEPARLAPSSVNSQPWYFVQSGNTFHTYCVQKGIFSKVLGSMNLIDVGICLAHMYVANSEKFKFFKDENAPLKKGYGYVGSFVI